MSRTRGACGSFGVLLLAALLACGSSSSGGTPADGGGGGDGGGSSSGSASSGGGSGGSSSSGGGVPEGGGGTTYGAMHSGQYNLGPVEWTGSYPNACAPYPAPVEMEEGAYLAGVDNSVGADGGMCDVCILVTTAKGKSLVARVITYGDSNSPGDIDLSQAAYRALFQGEYPRTMSWQQTKCPDTGKVQYQYQTAANPDWTSLWVRNARLPVTNVEVTSANHSTWFALTRGTDGTWTDGGGFGSGPFSLRVTAVDGQQVTDMFSAFSAGALVDSAMQFQ